MKLDDPLTNTGCVDVDDVCAYSWLTLIVPVLTTDCPLEKVIEVVLSPVVVLPESVPNVRLTTPELLNVPVPCTR